MSTVVSGRKPVIEAIKSGQAIEKIVIQYGARGDVVGNIRRLAKQHSVPVVEMDRQKFRAMAPEVSAQGVAAVLGETRYADVETILAAATAKSEKPLVLVLDEIEDPQNLGALIRTAECAGVHGVIIPKHHSAGVNETVVKASAGAALHIPIARVPNIASIVEDLKEAGLWIIGTSGDGTIPFYDANYTDAVAIVIGSEGKGIRRLVKEKCDFLVKIPLFGKVESLNASVAGALVIYEAVRKRGQLKAER